MAIFTRRQISLAGAAAALSPMRAWASSRTSHHGVVIRTPDLDAAIAFYGDGLGFSLSNLKADSGWTMLVCNMPLYLEEKSGGRPQQGGAACSEITFRSNDLEASARSLRSAGAKILNEKPFEVAVGKSIRFADNAGTVHHLIKTFSEPPAFAEPRVYNTGLEVPQASIPAVRNLLERGIGLKPMTEKYFPPSIPYLEADGGFAMMLHHNQPSEEDLAANDDPRPNDYGSAQIFVTNQLDAVAQAAVRSGALRLTRKPERTPFGRRHVMATPGGAPFELWSWR